jgi:ribonuclease P protein component
MIALDAEMNNCSGRLKKRPEFLCVAQKVKKWVSPSVIIQSLETDTNSVRFGFTATKKIGNAVIRNRAKRRLRAVSDALYNDPKLSFKSANIVFIARNVTPTYDWDQLVKDAKWCLKRLEISAKNSD